MDRTLPTGGLAACLFALLLAGPLACGGDRTECARATDCFAGELCLNGECAIEGTGESGSAEDPDSDKPPPGPGTDVDSGTSPEPSPDSGDESPVPVEPGLEWACVVDRATTRCEDPEPKINNDYSSAVILNDGRNAGCPTGDNLVTVDETYSGILCHTEPADWFQLRLVHCDTRSFFVRLMLTPTTTCDEAMTDLVVSHYPCDREGVLCDTGEDGAKIILIEFPAPPHPVVFFINFAALRGDVDLGNDRLGIQYDYDLHIEVY